MKRKRSFRALTMIVLFAIFSSGCATRLADMSVISTRNVSLDEVDLDRLPQVKGVSGKDSKLVILFIPLGLPHLEDAIDDALTKGGGDVMVDAVIHRKAWWFLIGEESIEVKGTVVKTRSN